MVEKQTKRDKEDNMFIKTPGVFVIRTILAKKGYKDKESITDRKREGG